MMRRALFAVESLLSPPWVCTLVLASVTSRSAPCAGHFQPFPSGLPTRSNLRRPLRSLRSSLGEEAHDVNRIVPDGNPRLGERFHLRFRRSAACLDDRVRRGG